MYSEKIVRDHLDRLKRDTGASCVYHSPQEIDNFQQQLKRNGKLTYNQQGMVTGIQKLTPQDAAFIRNEQILCKIDHAYGLTRYCHIINERGQIERFRFRTPQKILFEIIAEMQLEGIPIEIMILKARQLGMTTLVQLLMLLRIAFGYGINAVAASAEVQKSGLMINKLLMAYDMMPIWLVPRLTARSTESDSGKLAFGTLNTTFSIQHGNKMKGGIAQGWTPTLYHLSELALFPNPEQQVDMGLHKAVHPSANVFGIFESTGAGDDNWWAATWRYSKANWEDRRCRMRPVFLPWVAGIEIYPQPDWLRAHPVPANWHKERLPKTREHVAKTEAYVAHTDYLRRHLCKLHNDIPDRRHWWSDGRMPIEQQWFWECGHEEHLAKGREDIWYQEMAGDDIEALQRSAEGVFAHDTITEIDEARQKEVQAYAIIGQSIEDNHEPDSEEIDYDKERLPITFRHPRGDAYRWELIPMRHNPKQLEAWKTSNLDMFKSYGWGKLFVWREPREGVDYSIGIDTANGIGSDKTVICVTEVGIDGMPDIQAAEFRSPYVSHVEAFAFALPIAAYYSKFLKETPKRQPLVAAEQLRAVGDTVQLQMRKMGYSRFHKFIRYDKVKVSKADSKQMGWMTTGWSRPLLIDGFIHSVCNAWYQVNSPWTIHEMAHFEQHLTTTGKPKPEHAAGENDDGIFAAAISTFIAHDLDLMAKRSKHRFSGETARALPNLDFAPMGIMRVHPDEKEFTLDNLRGMLR